MTIIICTGSKIQCFRRYEYIATQQLFINCNKVLLSMHVCIASYSSMQFCMQRYGACQISHTSAYIYISCKCILCYAQFFLCD